MEGFGLDELAQTIDARYSTALEPNAPDAQHVEVTRQLIERLNAHSPSASILMILKNQVEGFFVKGPTKASLAFEKVRKDALEDTLVISEGKATINLSSFLPGDEKLYTTVLAWYPPMYVVALVLLIATPPDGTLLRNAARPQTEMFHESGLDTVRSQPSASFRIVFQNAKAAALGPQNVTTVVVVEIVDVSWLETRTVKNHLNFGHMFAVAIGPEGMVVWQSKGTPTFGYLFQEYLERGGGRVRDWKEAEDFVGKFEKLIGGTGTGVWNSKRDKLFKELFEVSLFGITDSGTVAMTVTPKFKPWVRIQVVQNVRASDVKKFHWI